METILELLPAALGVAVGVLVSLVASRIILGRLARIAARTATQLDDAMLGTLKSALPLWGALLGLHIGIRMSGVSPNVRETTSQVIIVLLGLSMSWSLARVAGVAVGGIGGPNAGLPAARILRTVVQLSVFLIGALITLSTIARLWT